MDSPGSPTDYAQEDPFRKHSAATASPSPSPSSRFMSHLNTTEPTASLSEGLNGLSLSSSPGPLLSPLDESRPLSRSTVVSGEQQQQPAPRRTPSSTSVRDERRRSTPNLKKRSSTASLRSVRNSSGGPPSPRPSLPAQRSPGSSLASKPPTPTAASVAAEHFQKEVESHQSFDLQSETLVVLHDDCYGHRFSRPRTSKAALSTIVERPERLRASALGVSAAYVRLGRRHANELFAPHPDLDISRLPVPFRIRKTARTMSLSSPAVTNVHGTKWMNDLKSMCDAAESRLALDGRELVRPRSANKDGSAANAPQLHEGDLYLCSESLNAFEGALGGVCEGIDAVFGLNSTKRVFIGIRPPGHHCSSGHPSGFCWINNVHVGISYAAMTHGLTHAAILDFDLHHGDGSQDISWEQNRKANAAHWNSASYKKAMVGYFSMHDINSYPCETGELEKVRNASVCIERAHGQSIWNVHLEPWKTDSEFWELYETKYSVLIAKARAFLRLHTQRLSNVPNGPPPKAAIFISAGFDASEWEGAGMQRHKVNVPTDFYAKFTADVVRMAEEEELGVDGRIISVLEGGYSDRALTSGVFSHMAGLGNVPGDAYSFKGKQSDRLATEMTCRSELHADDVEDGGHYVSTPDFSTEWWGPAMLDELESLMYPPQSPKTKTREKGAPTYFAPTRSFSAKVVAPARDRKSAGSLRNSEADSPPPMPDVNWATATHELFKVLVPSDRQTTSHQSVDLNAEASRLRKERQIAVQSEAAAATTDTATTVPDEVVKMQLRTRKSRTSRPSTPKKEIFKPQVAKDGEDRRTTIDFAGSKAACAPSVDRSPGSRTGRRESTTSLPATGVGQGISSRTVPERESRALSRPGTAMSSRSSMSTIGRKTSTTRTVASKQYTSPKRAPPVPKVPSTLGSAKSRDSKKGSRAASESRVEDNKDQRSLPEKENNRKHDVDGLSAGIQKLNIKLKVPSPEENAAREKEKRAAEGRRRTSSKTASRLTSKFGEAKEPGPTSNIRISDSLPVTTDLRTESEKRTKRLEHEPVSGGAPITVSVSSSSATAAPTAKENLETQATARETPRSDDTVNTSTKDTTRTSTTISPPLTPGIVQSPTHPPPTLYSPPPSSTSQIEHGLPVFSASGPIPFDSPR